MNVIKTNGNEWESNGDSSAHEYNSGVYGGDEESYSSENRKEDGVWIQVNSYVTAASDVLAATNNSIDDDSQFHGYAIPRVIQECQFPLPQNAHLWTNNVA